MITAEIVCDSIAPSGHRLTTFVLVFPRIVLAEFNTHRALSRNSASSRAIPFKKMVAMAKENPFIPLRFQKTHTGMQGNEYFEGADHDRCVELWLQARDLAVQAATTMDDMGITKQLTNRTLEAYQYHKVIATGTEWENFFALRAHPAAEIHITALAEKMLSVYNESKPNILRTGEWHIPFGDKFDDHRVLELVQQNKEFWRDDLDQAQLDNLIQNTKVKIATARCARVSYNNFEGKDDYSADLKLHDDLASSGHWSPFEHCARVPLSPVLVNGGNFQGFTQYRKTFMGENQKDSRVVLR